MNKKLIFTAALGTCLAASAAFAGGPEIIPEPDYFSGFFVGGTGAFHMAAFPGSFNASAPAVVSTTQTSIVDVPLIPPSVVTTTVTQTFFPAGTWLTNDMNGSGFNGYYGVQGGAGKVFNHRWYIGLVGFGEWGEQSDTVNSASQFTLANATNITITTEGQPPQVLATTGSVNGVYNASTTVKISNDYGVAFKPGFLVAPRTMFYGKVGAAWANLKISNSFSAISQENESGLIVSGAMAGASSSQDTKVGLLLGIGGEQFIYKNFVTINVEYNYVNYGNVSTVTPLTGQGSVQVGSGGNGPFVPPGASAVGDPVVLTGATAQSSANAKVSTLLAGLNFYFGSQWF